MREFFMFLAQKLNPPKKYARAYFITAGETTSFNERQLVFVTNPHEYPLKIDDIVFVSVERGQLVVQTTDTTGLGSQRVQIIELPNEKGNFRTNQL